MGHPPYVRIDVASIKQSKGGDLEHRSELFRRV